MRSLLIVPPLALLLALSPDAASAAPANTLNELGARLRACFAEVRLERGAAATVVFALRRDGSLLGKPRLAFASFTGDEDAQTRDAAEIAAALDRCLPLDITPALGGAIAGRPLTFPIAGPPADRGA